MSRWLGDSNTYDKRHLLTTTEPYSGKSIIALGLMNLLAGKTEKIAYFKPVISSEGTEKDSHLDTIIKPFQS